MRTSKYHKNREITKSLFRFYKRIDESKRKVTKVLYAYNKDLFVSYPDYFYS
jgi:hypothetical protein